MITENTMTILIAEAVLGAYVLLPWSDPALRLVAVGAFIGILGGHLNGRQGQSQLQSASANP